MNTNQGLSIRVTNGAIIPVISKTSIIHTKTISVQELLVTLALHFMFIKALITTKTTSTIAETIVYSALLIRCRRL